MVVLAIQLLMFAVLLGVTCLLCHSSDSETYCLAGLAGFFALTLYSWIKFLANVVSPFSSVCSISCRCEAVVLVVTILRGVFLVWSTPNYVVLTGV